MKYQNHRISGWGVALGILKSILLVACITSTINSQAPVTKIGVSGKSQEMGGLGTGQSLSLGMGQLWGTESEREDLGKTMPGSCCEDENQFSLSFLNLQLRVCLLT